MEEDDELFPPSLATIAIDLDPDMTVTFEMVRRVAEVYEAAAEETDDIIDPNEMFAVMMSAIRDLETELVELRRRIRDL